MNAFERLDVWKRGCPYVCGYSWRLEQLPGIWNPGSNHPLCAVGAFIADGYESDSCNKYMRFLRIAKGSCGELRTQFYIAREIGILDATRARDFVAEAMEISKMLRGLIKKLETQRE